MSLNRLMQKCISERYDYYTPKQTVARIHKYLVAFHSIVQEYIDKGILPSYQAGYIALDKQFGTIGINGALESFEWFTMRERMETNDYTDYLGVILAGIKEDNKRLVKFTASALIPSSSPLKTLVSKMLSGIKKMGYGFLVIAITAISFRSKIIL